MSLTSLVAIGPWQIIIIVVVMVLPRVPHFSLFLYHVFNVFFQNPPKRLVKVAGPSGCLLLLYLFFSIKNGATAWDVPTFLEKTSHETLTFQNHPCKNHIFCLIFLSWGLLGGSWVAQMSVFSIQSVMGSGNGLFEHVLDVCIFHIIRDGL